MDIEELLERKRKKIEENRTSIPYRCLAPLKLFSITTTLAFVLILIFGPMAIYNNIAIAIFVVGYIFAILYSFDYLFVIIYIIYKKNKKLEK